MQLSLRALFRLFIVVGTHHPHTAFVIRSFTRADDSMTYSRTSKTLMYVLALSPALEALTPLECAKDGQEGSLSNLCPGALRPVRGDLPPDGVGICGRLCGAKGGGMPDKAMQECCHIDADEGQCVAAGGWGHTRG